jgi:hypothetical protein
VLLTRGDRSVAWALATSMLLLACTLVYAQSSAQKKEDNPEVSQLLAEAKEKAAVLSRDADDMEALTRSAASWQSHAVMLDTVKDHVNDLGRTVEKLTVARDSAAPWQQKAIDRMLPLMKELASNTTAAIEHIKEHQSQPNVGSYPEYLRANADTAHQLAYIISSFVEYGETKAKLARLEQRLEIASK